MKNKTFIKLAVLSLFLVLGFSRIAQGAPIEFSGYQLRNTDNTLTIASGVTSTDATNLDQVGSLITAATSGFLTSAGPFPWANVTGTPTTLSGYGITDAVSSALTSTHIIVGSAGNIATPIAMSGDVNIATTGVTTIQPLAITTGKIGNNQVTYGKIQNLGSLEKLLGSSDTTLPVQEIGLGNGLLMNGTNVTVDANKVPLIMDFKNVIAVSSSGTLSSTLVPNGSNWIVTLSPYCNLTAVGIGTIVQMRVNYIDIHGNSQTTNFFSMGLTSANLTAIGTSNFPPVVLRVQAASTLSVTVTIVASTATYDAGYNVIYTK